MKVEPMAIDRTVLLANSGVAKSRMQISNCWFFIFEQDSDELTGRHVNQHLLSRHAGNT